MKKTILMMVAGVSCAASYGATIDRVLLRQDWPWSNRVRVDYVITDVTEPVDVTATFSLGSTPLAMSAVKGNVVGDLFAITTAGEKSFSFNPKAVFPNVTAKKLQNLCVQLTAVPTAYPKAAEVIYKIVNLDRSPMTITDVTRAEILNGKYGTYETDYGKIGPDFTTTLSDVLIWTGVTNGDLYRTSKLALRKIPAAGQSYAMTGSINVSFTNDFYMGVFELTQCQAKMIKSDFGCWYTNELCWATRAATASWTTYRGNKDGVDYLKAGWPHGNHSSTMGANSILGKLQAATGNPCFDLPTEAQWEFAACGGNYGSVLPSGKSNANVNHINEMGTRWSNAGGDEDKCVFGPKKDPNGGTDGRNCSTDYGTDVVGRALPNAYGLYDVLNNAFEWTLNRYCSGWSADPLRGGVEPRGTISEKASDSYGNYGHVICGGGFAFGFFNPGSRWTMIDWYGHHYLGARICLHGDNAMYVEAE